ncbi:TetR family transcriptional regulator C-terminal domain-containing protein [Actinomadura rupiterrae]|uniref:TetR family transcriptional regulator C-terminal domain-containing protein n=1 Tax=Actinomadura rupiterrae TaxID=559627 RepID=UPI0020A5F85A|nr:TetR/AcrR family transcriptional regulator [Actinomadura rupiterrae]MCP2334898.1 AcrR family transcriptional regulator [Actinomadura rupiterrae]
MSDNPDPAVTDGRLLRGARSRRAITRHAVDVASLEGLNGLSLGRLATDLDLSKSGIQTLFRTKENLHLATVEAARDLFVDAVVRPAQSEPHGVARLNALIENWIAYAEKPLFTGGCFWAANLPDFDSRPGPVRDALADQRRDWQSLIATELRHAMTGKQIAPQDPDLAAFQIDAILNATNTALRLDDPQAPTKARRALTPFLTHP